MRHVGIPLGGQTYEVTQRQAYHAGTYTVLHDPIHGGLIMSSKQSSQTKMASACLTAIVTASNGEPRILSNTHVMRYWDYYSAKPDSKRSLKPFTSPDPLYQPPTYDGFFKPTGLPARQIGTVLPSITTPRAYFPKGFGKTAMAPYVAGSDVYMDACIAKPSVNITYDVPGIGILTGHTEPKDGMEVLIKTGWEQDVKTGKVIYGDAWLAPGGVGWDALAAHMFSFTTNKKVLSGDSGALVVEKGTNKAVGVLVGVLGPETVGYPSSGGLAYGTRASIVVSKYGVSFVGK